MPIAWTLIGLLGAALASVVGLIGMTQNQVLTRLTALETQMGGVRQDLGRIVGRLDGHDTQFASLDQRFDRVNQRFDRIERQAREDKAELLQRLDIIAERVTHLERRGD